MDFKQADEFISALDAASRASNTHRYAFAEGIARARTLLGLMGGAPRATCNCAIVTGSKGKGSTVTMLAHMLASSGLRVGAFTGPHLHKTTERFAVIERSAPGHVQRDEMPDGVFSNLAGRVREAVSHWPTRGVGTPTRFEAFTAMAYRWFENIGCDFNIIEVGIGGKNDATNLAEPAMSVFTNISLEHTQILGATLHEIALEKSGIMRTGALAVIGHQPPEALVTLHTAASRCGAHAIDVSSRWRVRSVRHQLDRAPIGQWVEVTRVANGATPKETFLPLAGHVQAQNLATALAATEAMRERGYHVDVDAALDSLKTLRWPGRFEVLQSQPLIIADGAHTPHSIRELIVSLQSVLAGRKLHFVFGALRDKDVPGMLAHMLVSCSSLQLVTIENKRAVTASQLGDWCEGLPKRLPTPLIAQHPALDPALRQAAALAGVDGGAIVVCGSLHLVAEAQSWANCHEKHIVIRN